MLFYNFSQLCDFLEILLCVIISWVIYVKVLTLKQPWATLVAEGIKIYEFRSWKTKYRGKVLIHAGAGVDKKDMVRLKELNYNYPASKIVAIADLDDCLELDEKLNDEIIAEGNIAYGNKRRTGYAWKLKNIKKVKYDAEVKGKLGLWNYEINEEDLELI